MTDALIIQVPRGSRVHRQLDAEVAARADRWAIVVEALPPDTEGNLDPPAAGEVVLSVPSPESLAREPEQVSRVLSHAGTGTEPLVVVIDAADELREEELAPVRDAASRAHRAVILRIIRSG
jgi:hypothetical protein